MDAFLHAYLAAFVFWSQPALGAAGILMIYRLTGGDWGQAIERPLLAVSRTIYVVAALFLPIALGANRIYAWANAVDPTNPSQSVYLNTPFFIGRSVFYLAVWIGLAYFLVRWSDRLRQAPDSPAVHARLQALSAGGLVVYGFTVSFAAFDWVMSLEPRWSSTIYGLLFWVGQGLSAFSLALCLSYWSGLRTTAKVLLDLGNILLAFIMLWAYLAFMQYLVMWSGNKPDEAVWFLVRSRNGWQYFTLLIATAQFAAPFGVLLFRRFKSNIRYLAWLGLAILAVRAIEVFWLVMPDLRTGGASLRFMDLTVFIGVGALWMVFFLRSFRKNERIPGGVRDV